MSDALWDAVEHLRDCADVAEAAVTELGPTRGTLTAEERGRLKILRAALTRATERLDLELAWCEPEQGEHE